MHTTSSTMIGHNAFGHPVFDTRRSALGELLYRLKNRGDESVVGEIVDAARRFINRWGVEIDAVVPVPPSNMVRRRQPVFAVATLLSESLGVPLCGGCLTKIKRTAQLKDIFDYTRRFEVLSDAFVVDPAKTCGRRLLLFDDLYRSGATVSAISRLLSTQGAAQAVYLVTLTQTRKLA